MILNNAPQQEAVLSNVGEIGEFRIRNSAKAFNILSSGLYANKVRAIIRELSCNAVDSHIAAGKGDTPFETHLPTTLEPFFSIRDFGTGLSHDQVTNIYTTYFESTKTASNEFIGALGLGSKSPFSYTDNFTVTAIKDGRKGIYSAFINGEGVPSIALMGEEETQEPNGVEVKFSVNDRFDFSKFSDEARNVYLYFKLRPIIKGNVIAIPEMEYETKDIIPGVHSTTKGRRSMAVMGNIAYPIDIPQADKNLGDLHKLLECSLVMEFGIGELDFQASREGLSYIPQTIDAIKRKIEQVNDQLAIHIAAEADKIENLWERSIFLFEKKRIDLWASAVIKYVEDTDFPLFDKTESRWSSNFILRMKEEDLAAMNLHIKSFRINRNEDMCRNQKIDKHNFGKLQTGGYPLYESCWNIPVEDNVSFVFNDTKIGCLERAKNHWREKDTRGYRETVFVVEPIDKKQVINKKAFLDAIHNPPELCLMNASDLIEKPRNGKSGGIGRDVTILSVQERGGNRYHASSSQLVWRDAGRFSEFDKTKTYYYVPLLGFSAQMQINMSVHELVSLLHRSHLQDFQIVVYGVRKTDIEEIKKQSNWVNVEDFVKQTLKTFDNKFAMSLVKSNIDDDCIFKYDLKEIVNKLEDGETKTLLTEFIGLPKKEGINSIQTLMRYYRKDFDTNHSSMLVKYNDKFNVFTKRYPLIDKLEVYRSNSAEVADYINMVDKVKGV